MHIVYETFSGNLIYGLGSPDVSYVIPISLMIRTVQVDYAEYKRSKAASPSEKAACGVTSELSRGDMLRSSMFYAAFGTISLGCSSGLMVMTQTSAIMQQCFMYNAAQGFICASAMSLMNITDRFFW